MSSEAVESEYAFVLNHLKVCRLCLSEELLEDILKCDGLIQWISDFLSIVVSEDDIISCSICALCRARLNEFRDFKVRCHEVQDVLHGESSTSFDKHLLLSAAEKGKFSSEAHPELTVNARDKLQLTIADIEVKTDEGEKKAYQNKKIECSTCGNKIRKSNIESHQNRHKGGRRFKCERGCKNKDFDSRKTQQQHHRDVHSGERYECNMCQKVFHAKRHLRMHKKNMHWSKMFQCSICNLQYTACNDLYNHMKRMHDPNRKRAFSCLHCNSSFKTYGYLQTHLMKMHPMKMLEKSPKKKLVTKRDALGAPKVNNEPEVNSVRGHLGLYEKEAANIEPDSATKQGQDDYISAIENDNSLLVSQELKISDINKKLHSEDVLKKFQKRTEPSPIQKNLPFGEVEIGETSSETYPELTINAKEKLQPTIPGIEDEADDDKKRPYQRIVSESGQKRYYNAKKETYQNKKIKCCTCGEKIYKSQIEGHQNRHKGVRPFKCELGCENVDFDSQRVQNQHHREIHSDERYDCSICNKVFRAQRHLSLHKVNVHSSKAFLCSVCNLRFKSRNALHGHMKRIHDPNYKRKFPCLHCNSSYDRYGNLQNHLKQVHFEEIIGKSKRIRKKKPVTRLDSLEAPKVKIEPDVEYVETQDVLQDDSYAAVEGNLDLFEAEDAKIEPDLNPE